MAHGVTPITGIANTIIGGVTPSVATGTPTNSADVNDLAQAVANDIATISTGNCTLSGNKTFSGPLTCAFAGTALIVNHDATISGALVCDGQVSVSDNIEILSGGELEGALGSICAWFGSVEGKASSVWLFGAGCTTTFDNSPVFNDVVHLDGGAALPSGKSLTCASGSTLTLSAGSSVAANTSIQSATVQVAVAATMVLDASTSNMFAVTAALNTGTTFVFNVINAVDGWKGTLVYFTSATPPAAPTVQLNGSGVVVAGVAAGGGPPAFAGGKTYVYELRVFNNGAGLQMILSIQGS